MTTQNITLFKALGAKMDYLNQRQRVVSQNIANADTPGYQPKDLTPVDFGRVLKNVTNGRNTSVKMDTTDAQHFPPPNTVPDARSREQKETYEVAPVGNAVIMEEQLVKSGQTVMDYNLMANIYQKNIQMMRLAMGSQR